MHTNAANLSFTSNKHCFLCLPKSWKLKSSDTKLVVLEVRGQDGFVYTAWSGDVQAKHNEEEKVGLSGLFASKHGLKDDETVLVKTVDNVVSCERVEVEPLSVDDWEIMELNASYIANNMLNQVRVVWPGQIVPLWIQKSVCIFVKIGFIEPNGPCSMLVERTQVLIQPKSKGFSNTSSQNTHSVPQGSTSQNTRSVPSSSQNKNSGTKPKQNKIGHRKSKSALNGTDLNNQIANKNNKSQNNTNTDALNKSSETSISDNQQGLISSFVSYISSFWSSPVSNLKANEQSVNFEEYLGKQIEAKLRIQCITYFIDTGSCVTNSEHTNRLDFSDVLELRPDTVYVGSDTLEYMFSGKVYSEDNFGAESRRQSFLVSLKKLPSPAETEEIMRKKMEKQGKSRRSGSGTGAELDQTSGIQNVDTFPPENETSPVIVRVVVLQSGKHCTKSFIKQISSVQNVNNSAESSAETTENLQESAEKFESREQNVGLCYEKHILCGHIVFHNLLRRQMSVDLTGSVKIETISPEVKPSQPNEIRLHPLFTIPDGFTNDMLIVAFKSYIETTTSAAFPLVVSQGILIKCVLKPDFHGEFLVTFPSQVNDLKQKSEFVILCKQTLEQLKVKVTKEKPEVVKQLPLWSLEQIDPHLPEKSVEQLGGVADLVTSCISHIELTLSQKPLAKYVLKKAHPMSNGGLLISGGRGIGKSCLVKAVCRDVSGYPNLAYCVIVDCKQLKGKRVDSIRRHMEKAVNEAAWRQPAVLVLEDLDVVCAAPNGPEQEMSGEALYYTRVAEVVKDILKLELTQGTKLAVIATVRNRSSLHNTLSVGSGNHMFHKVITMDPPDKIQRAAILKALMLNKPLLAHTVTESIDIFSIANQTEGYVARDLETVVERAIHVCMMKSTETGRTIEKEIKLSDEDFRAALKDFTPSSLRNVTLHTPSDTCWEDVGGLVEVKNTLVETLQWPSKYPVLFASCPLRLRSGILLYGAPGTGKTLLAGVVAKECGLNFISIKGPELLSKYIGASEQAVRDTFVRAQSAKPCILFFDEFDSLAPRRGHDSTGVTDRVVNQLLTQLDGVEGLEGVYVLGATSRPDLIDPALLRPGRLDKALHCPLPTKEERYEILRALTRSMNLADDVNLTTIANTTDFFTGADFKALLYNAQLNAIHDVTPGLGTEGSERETVTLNNEPDKRVDRSAILNEEPNSGNGEMVRSDEENVEHKLKRELSAMSTGSWEKVNFSNKESFENIAPNHPTAESSQTELKTTLDTLLFKDDLNLESNKGTGVKDDSNLGIKGDTEVKVMEKIPDKRIVYIPSLEDGPQDLDSEEEGRLYEKVKHYIEDTPEVEDKAKKPISIQIQQRHLEAALQEMGPSVSEKERRKYKRIYENFVGSRGGNFSDGTQTVGKKATLA